MKHSAEYQRLTELVDQLMSVQHEEIKRREAEYKKQYLIFAIVFSFHIAQLW